MGILNEKWIDEKLFLKNIALCREIFEKKHTISPKDFMKDAGRDNKRSFRKLVRRYLAGKSDFDESKAVEGYYDLFSEEPDATNRMDGHMLGELDERLRSGIWGNIKREQTIRFYQHSWARVAAILITVLGVVGFFYKWQRAVKFSDNQSAAISIKPSKSNRYISLPDGSKVLLREGSHMSYNKDFNKTTREVTLIGEAYFDVVHIEESEEGNEKRVPKPFIIHTGKVKTTVLGTAFEIRAWPSNKNVTVTVSRGKVKVEHEGQLIAILTKDKQVSYNLETSVSGERKVKAAELLTWAQSDMTFDEMSFDTLAAHLGRRYNVKIIFKNPELARCFFTGRFTGTESLEEVLNILTATSNTRYIVNDQKQIVIDGDACN
jgi:transmembrane sensor